jgi:hypothetical protein
MRGSTAIFAVLLALSLGGCVTDPQPIPVPAPATQAMYLSGESPSLVLLAGEPGAVDSEVEGLEIVVRNPSVGQTYRAPVHADGSFLLPVQWQPKQTLTAWVELDDRAGPEVQVELPRGVATIMVPPTIDSISPVAPGTGQTTITGSAKADALLLAGNPDQSAARSVVVDSSGRFSLAIDAASGDRIAIFYVDLQTRAASPAVEGRVPES